MINYSVKVHDALIAGTKKAIAWGASADVYLKIQKSPYSFDCIIDKNAGDQARCICGIPVLPIDVLADKNAKDYVIVVFADLASFGDIIINQAETYGSFVMVPPFCPWKQFGAKKMLGDFKHFIAPCLQKRALLCGATSSKKVALLIGRLSRGGAEKQMILLALALKQQNYEVYLYTAQPDAGGVEDWHNLLIESGVKRQMLTSLSQTEKASDYRHGEQLINLFSCYATHVIGQLATALATSKPQFLISYMPSNCLIALVAGLLSDIAQISLSFRNVAPSDRLEDEYSFATLAVSKNAVPQLLSASLSIPGVTLTHNSEYGRASYAKWMNVAEGEMQVVHNGMLPIKYSAVDLIEHHTIDQEATVIVGVMRLVEQKRPELFLEVVGILKDKIANLRVFLIGDGPLHEKLANQIVEHDLSAVVELVGNYGSPTDYMRIAHVLLHTPYIEGFPNVLLEAQAAGCPIVATDAGGSAETMNAELRSLSICHSNNPRILAERVIRILNPENSLKFAQFPDHVVKEFSLENLAARTINACLME